MSQCSGITLSVFLLTTKQTHESGSSTKPSATEVLRMAFRYQKNPFRRECQLKKKKKKKRIEEKKSKSKGKNKTDKPKKKKQQNKTKINKNKLLNKYTRKMQFNLLN